MIFDYPNNKFIEDGRTNRLVIDGFAFMIHKPDSGLLNRDADPMASTSTLVSNVEFVFMNRVLRVYAGGQQITNITKLLFIMSESEVSAAQEQMYRRTIDTGMEAIAKASVLSPALKVTIQKCIDEMALANGITVPENINFFNDKFILYMFPLLRTLTNSSTNFYKILEDLRFSDDHTTESYLIPYKLMENFNLSDGLKAYLGTSSKEITKFVAQNIVRKTDLVKSLSPQLLEILINHSGKIFANANPVEPQVRILTCYEDVMLDVIMYVRFVMDIFSNNIDHTQKFLSTQSTTEFRTDRKVSEFLSQNFTPKKIFNLLGTNSGINFSSLSDTASQYNTYKSPDSIPGKLRFQYPNGLELPKNWKTLKELHDKVSADYNKIKAEDNNKTIPYEEHEWQLHGMKDGNVELTLPSEGATLVTWGKEQSHCVASYADSAASKRCLIVGVKINGQHLYTMELRTHTHERMKIPDQPVTNLGSFFQEDPWQKVAGEREKTYSCEIVQFHGYSNKSPETYGDQDLRKKVLAMLKTVFTANSNSYETATTDATEALRYALAAGNVFEQGPLVIRNVAGE